MPFSPRFFSSHLPMFFLLSLTPFSSANADDDDIKDRALTIVVEKDASEETVEQALTPGGVTVVDMEENQQRSQNNIADVLRYVPGLYVESNNGTDGVFFSSRGSNLDAVNYDGNGIKQLQDGLPVTTADGNNHNRIVDPANARTATVAKGANAQAYGASTLGGAINYVSPTARNTEGHEVQLDGGSHGQLSGRLSLGHVFNDRFDGLISVESKRWDGYRDHNKQERSGIYANAGFKVLNNVTSRLFISKVKNDQELPGALTEAEYESDPEAASPSAIGGNFQKDVDTFRVASKTDIQLSENSQLTLGLSYEEQSLFHPIVDKILVDFDGPGPNPPVEVFSLLVDTDHKEQGAVLRYNLHWGEHNILTGLNYGDSESRGGNYRNDGGRKNGLSTRINNKATNKEAFIVDRWRLGTGATSNWTLVYGLQAVESSRDVRNTDATTGQVRNPSADYSDVNPRLGVIYDLDENAQLFANASRLFEAPTNFELEDDVRGNNEPLDPMTGTVFEVGSRGRRALGNDNSWHWDLALFYAQLEDEILSVDDPAAPGNSLTTNIDQTIHAGIEALFGASFALAGNPAHRLEPLLSLTLNDFSFDGDAVYGDNKLPAAPDYIARGEVIYRHANGFFAGPTVDFVGERYADFDNSYKVDDYSLLGFRTGLVRKQWEVYAEFKNLLDEKYVSSLTVRNTADPNAAFLNPGLPRSLFVGTRYRF